MKLGILKQNANISSVIWGRLSTPAKWRLVALLDGDMGELTLAQIGQAAGWR